MENMREKIEMAFLKFQNEIIEICPNVGGVTACVHSLPTELFNRKGDKINSRDIKDSIIELYYVNSELEGLNLFSMDQKFHIIKKQFI